MEVVGNTSPKVSPFNTCGANRETYILDDFVQAKRKHDEHLRKLKMKFNFNRGKDCWETIQIYNFKSLGYCLNLKNDIVLFLGCCLELKIYSIN